MIFTFNPKGGGGSTKVYATLDIKTTEAELAGKDITITFEDETYTVQGTKMGTVLDSFGYYHAKDEIKVQSLGKYTITCGEAEDTVDVLNFGTNDVELELTYWLFKDGDKCINKTGGYTNIINGTGTVTFNTDSISIIANTSRTGPFTTNSIDLSKFTKLKVELEGKGLEICKSTGFAYADTKQLWYNQSQLTKQTITYDLTSSDKDKPYHIGVSGNWGTTNAKIYKIWLE